MEQRFYKDTIGCFQQGWPCTQCNCQLLAKIYGKAMHDFHEIMTVIVKLDSSKERALLSSRLYGVIFVKNTELRTRDRRLLIRMNRLDFCATVPHTVTVPLYQPQRGRPDSGETLLRNSAFASRVVYPDRQSQSSILEIHSRFNEIISLLT